MKSILQGVIAIWLCSSVTAVAQDQINVYDFVLGIDVPESPALVTMGILSHGVYLGSAPKPISSSITTSLGVAGEPRTAAALDVAPYYLFANGSRQLTSYRSRSFLGRAHRVIIKTLFSIAVTDEPGANGNTLFAIALRSTFHDPHDPVLNSRLYEDVEQARRDAQDAKSGDVSLGLKSLYARTSDEIRARKGDAQVSGGWGLSGSLPSGAVDASTVLHHTIWMTGQYTAASRYDLLATAQLRDAFDRNDWIFGSGILCKNRIADVQVDVTYSEPTNTLHPSLGVACNTFSHVKITTAVLSDSGLSFDQGSGTVGDVNVRITAQYFYSSFF